jgi:phage-related protein
MPKAVKASFGFRLRRIQEGKPTLDTKALSQFGSGVYELREAFEGDAFRLMYLVRLRSGIYVLHAFKKKSKSGIGLPKRDKELIERRLASAVTLDKEINGEKD